VLSGCRGTCSGFRLVSRMQMLLCGKWHTVVGHIQGGRKK